MFRSVLVDAMLKLRRPNRGGGGGDELEKYVYDGAVVEELHHVAVVDGRLAPFGFPHLVIGRDEPECRPLLHVNDVLVSSCADLGARRSELRDRLAQEAELRFFRDMFLVSVPAHVELGLLAVCGGDEVLSPSGRRSGKPEGREGFAHEAVRDVRQPLKAQDTCIRTYCGAFELTIAPLDLRRRATL